MRIAHVITRLIVGGAQENTLLSCEGQHDLGHEVTLITGPAIGPEGSLLQRAQAHGYPAARGARGRDEGRRGRGRELTLIPGPAVGPEGSLMQRAQAYGYRVETVDEMRRSIL